MRKNLTARNLYNSKYTPFGELVSFLIDITNNDLEPLIDFHSNIMNCISDFFSKNENILHDFAITEIETIYILQALYGLYRTPHHPNRMEILKLTKEFLIVIENFSIYDKVYQNKELEKYIGNHEFEQEQSFVKTFLDLTHDIGYKTFTDEKNIQSLLSVLARAIFRGMPEHGAKQ